MFGFRRRVHEQAPPRRPATPDELLELEAASKDAKRPRSFLACLLAMLAGFLLGAFALANSLVGLAIGAFSIAGLALIWIIILAFLGGRAIKRVLKVLSVADPALTPIVPITEGDRGGPWIVVSADARSLHVSRIESLRQFQFRRLMALLGGVGLMAGGIGLIVAIFMSPKGRAGIAKGIFGLFGFAYWVIRYAVGLYAYQWRIEENPDAPGTWTLEIQDERLFARSSVVTVRPAEIRAFHATPKLLFIELTDGAKRPLAGLGGDSLAGWRAACFATTIAGLMDVTCTLHFEDAAKRPTQIAIPAEYADDAMLSPSTTGLKPQAT